MENQTPMAVQQTTVIQVGSQKSVAGAVLLGLFFGPLGMLYATVVGALIMFAISFIVAFVTLGLGLLITTPICAIWAGIAASNHNKQLGFAGQQAVMPGQAGPAGWHQDPAGSGRLRYYDGARWTDHYADQTPPSQPPAAVEEVPVAAALERSPEPEPEPPEPTAEPEPEPPERDPAPVVEESEAPTAIAAVEAPAQVFCGSCGASVSAEARFCSACGGAQAAV